MDYKENIIPHDHQIKQADRINKNGFQPKLIWFTGLSGSGKSTLAGAFETYLFNQNFHTYILDGDNVRSGLNQDLDFSDVSRKENIRRIAEVSRLMIDAGLIVITAFISPFDEERELAKSLVLENNYFLVHVNCSVAKCEERDVKGLYKKARNGEIKNFTGIDSPYEIPKNPNLIVDTEKESINESVDKIFIAIKNKIKG